MAPTSSSIGNASAVKFDVFINHRGKDVKDTLASHIYNTLDLIKVRAFWDREKFEPGQKIMDALKEAISGALVHIAIFSPKYAQSRWCLEELTLMLRTVKNRTDKKFIPIFYHVEPGDLKRVAEGGGVYADAFSKHEKGRYRSKLKKWKKALFDASDFSGLEINEVQKDEGHLVMEIVKIVNNVMKHQNMPLLDVATHPVGLDEAIEDFQKFVETQSICAQSRENVNIVGIVGLGGCGKTTLAKEYFNRKRSCYTESSFVFEVRDAGANNRLHDLQSQLLRDLVHIKEAFHNESQGKRTLEHRVRSMKVLIILDDVSHLDQIKALLPLKGNLSPESLIIVTTCDSEVIKSSASLSPSISVSVYEKRGLDVVRAKQLFCWHAFKSDSPVNGFEDLVGKFLNACEGLPLSLKVLGGQLYGKNKNYWESEFQKISKILPNDIKQRLKISYKALDKEQKEMFLDIACFFIGEEKDMVISIWDGSGRDHFLWSGLHGFQILENKCLVEVDHKNQNRIRMHGHLRDLGREVAIEKRPSRFWSHLQFINSQEILPIRGIMAAKGFILGDLCYCNSHYKPPLEECMELGHSTSRSRKRSRRLMSSAVGLQLLAVRGDDFNEQFRKLSEELVWLRWYQFPHRKLPSWLSTGKLRVLELYQPQKLEELWGPNDAPRQLRELIIHSWSHFYNLRMIPKTIGSLEHLKKIVLKSGIGQNESKISRLPKEFCDLKCLEHLELPGFCYLSSLPKDFGNLRKLKYINLSRCAKLTALPVTFNKLTELQYLDLSWCSALQLGKKILKYITQLKEVRLDGCCKPQQLPSEITRQMYLRKLCLLDTRLSELPADIGSLAKLEVLKIGGPCLTSIPASLGSLSSLIRLKIDSCRKLKSFRSLGNLSSLIRLTIRRCFSLKHLPPVECLTRLENLKLEWLGVEYLPEGFGQLVNLQKLKICCCPIKELRLANPEKLYSKKPRRHSKKPRRCIKKPTLLNHVNSSMFKFIGLKRTHLCGTKVSTVSKPRRYYKKPRLLNHVDSSMFKYPRLKSIHLSDTKVSTVSISEDCCPSLEDLSLLRNNDLMEMETLPRTLKRVVIINCQKLRNISCVAGLVELRYLQIQGCPELVELPSFARCTSLKDLKIDVSSGIKGTEALKEARSLNTLQIRAESRSAIEKCIPLNLLKRPPCTMEILGRALEDIESRALEDIDSFSFPDYTVVDEVHSSYGGWKMKAGLWNASCVIACFVISCDFLESWDEIIFRVGFSPWGPGDSYIRLLGGKQIYIVVWPQGFGFTEGSESVFLRGHSAIGPEGLLKSVQVKKGMAVILRKGKEKKASDVLDKFLELLKP